MISDSWRDRRTTNDLEHPEWSRTGSSVEARDWAAIARASSPGPIGFSTVAGT